MGIPDLEAVEQHSEAVERRTDPRVSMGGQPVLVDAGDGREYVTCHIVNLSKRGACITTPKGVALPYLFRIAIEGRWRYADTVWTRWPQLGLQFVK
jgi:hypothetical protein